MLVVDTCIFIDVADDDPEFDAMSADCLAWPLTGGLTISPVSYVELAPVFDGSRRVLDEFLAGLGVDASAVFDLMDRQTAFSAWARHIRERRARRSGRRPVADVLIGALAARHDGLITRHGEDLHLSGSPDRRPGRSAGLIPCSAVTVFAGRRCSGGAISWVRLKPDTTTGDDGPSVTCALLRLKADARTEWTRGGRT